jgi:hypothetical protein
MAGSFGDYLEAKILDAVWGQTGLPAIGTTYIALYTVIPTDANASGTEVTGGSYARVAFTNNTTNWPNASGTNPSTKSNGVAITFPAPTANWGTVVGLAVYDAATVGNELAWAPLTTALTINNGNPAPSFAIGALVITID